MRKKKSMSIIRKLTLIIVSILLLFGVVTFALTYVIMKNNTIKDINETLYDQGVILSESINQETLNDIIKKPGTDNEKVTLMSKKLNEIVEKSDAITNIYIMAMNGESISTPVFSSNLLDLGMKYNQDLIDMGVSEELMAIIKDVFKKKQPIVTDVFVDQTGSYKTGLTPVFGEDGSLIAVYGIGYDISLMNQKIFASLFWIQVVTALFLLLSAIALYWLLRVKLTPIQEISRLTMNVAEGNLDVRALPVNSNDEIAVMTTNFNLMVESLKTIINSASAVSKQVSNSAQVLSSQTLSAKESYNTVADSIQEVANSADIQVHKSNEATITMEEMNIGLQRIAVTSSQMSEFSLVASNEVIKGNDSTKQSVSQMRAISKAVNESSAYVKTLDSHSEKIEAIVEIITGIASQTNLLSLNAAIEAARAGEAGKGFAVVADEVRKLAEQSDASAREISTLISLIQQDTKKSVRGMMVAVEEVDNGLLMIGDTERSFNEISSSMHQVTDQIQDLSATLEEMAAGMEEVTASVKDMEEFSVYSQNKTRTVAESSVFQLNSINQISNEAEVLTDLSSKLLTVVNSMSNKS